MLPLATEAQLTGLMDQIEEQMEGAADCLVTTARTIERLLGVGEERQL